MNNSNLAFDYSFDPVVKNITEKIKDGTEVLNQLLTLSDSETIYAIDHFKSRLQESGETEKAQLFRSQIDLLERNLMAKHMLIAYLLNSNDATKNIPSSPDGTGLTAPNNYIESKEPAKKDNLKPGPKVKETKKEQKGKVLNMKGQRIDGEAKEETKPSEDVALTQKQIREQTYEILSTKEDEAEANAKTYAQHMLTNGLYQTEGGKPGDEFTVKQFEGWWKDTLGLYKDLEERLSEEKPKEEPKLTQEEEDIKAYVDAFGNDPVKLEISKPGLTEKEEEKALKDISGILITIRDDKKLDDETKSKHMDTLMRLAFMDRPYNDNAINKWRNLVLKEETIESHLDYLRVHSVNNLKFDNFGDIVKMGQRLVQIGEYNRDKLFDWFKHVTRKKGVKNLPESGVDTEDRAEHTFKSIFTWLFQKKDNDLKPNEDFDKEGQDKFRKFVTEQMDKILSEEKEEKHSITPYIKAVKEALSSDFSGFSLEDIRREILNYLKGKDHKLYIEYQKKVEERNKKDGHTVNPTTSTSKKEENFSDSNSDTEKKEEIKPNETPTVEEQQEKKEPTETKEPGTEETTEKESEKAEPKESDSGDESKPEDKPEENGDTPNPNKEGEKGDDNSDDSKTEEKSSENSDQDESKDEQKSDEKTEKEEKINPKNDEEQSAPTVSEDAKNVSTDQPAQKETEKENSNSDEDYSSYNNILQSAKQKSFRNAVVNYIKKYETENKEESTDSELKRIAHAIKNAKDHGKYVRGIRSNPEEDILNQVTNIIKNYKEALKQ